MNWEFGKMKLIFTDLTIEMTRQCEQACKHCNRGMPQDIYLSKETIDSFFDNNDIEEITSIEFTGGDPTLNGDMINYIVDKIIENNIIVKTFKTTIDGKTFSKPLAIGLEKLNNYCGYYNETGKYIFGELIVSNDQFHEPYDPEILKQYSYLTFFRYPKSTVEKLHQKNIMPYGRAYYNKLSNQRININNLLHPETYYQLYEENDIKYMVLRNQYISSNGNVITNKDLSYDFIDIYKVGNVLETSIEYMYMIEPKVLKLRH